MIAANDDQNLFDLLIRYWGCFTCRPELENDDYIAMVSFDNSISLESLPVQYFPIDEMLMMVERHDMLGRPLGIIERPPVACGVVKRMELIGIFPTCRWMTDVTMPPDVKELFGGTPFFPLGEYRVANIDVIDSAGTLHSLTLILNKGVEGMLTGYWGAAFARNDPHECWARFETSGSHETSVREECDIKSSKLIPRSLYQEFDRIDFCEEYFEAGFAPGSCKTQLERILGLTAQFLLDIEWKDWLPDKLLEVRETSSKLERKRRARIARQRAATRIGTRTASIDNVATPKSAKRSEATNELFIPRSSGLIQQHAALSRPNIVDQCE